jgi:hypothetical protein
MDSNDIWYTDVYGCSPIIIGGSAFSYIFNFLRTAETISLNLGRNEVLKIPYNITSVVVFKN